MDKIYIQPQYWIIKYLWVIILLPKYLQFLVILILAILLYSISKNNLIWDTINIGLIGVFSLHGISIIINVLLREYDIQRILASVNTCMLWFLAFCFYSFYSQSKISISKIGKYACINMTILFVLNWIALFIYYGQKIDQYLINGNILYSVVYLNGNKNIRFMGLNDYSNLAVQFIIIFFPLGLLYVNRMKKVWRIIYYIFCSIAIISVHSRSGLLIWVIASAWYFPGKYMSKKKLIGFILTITGITIIILNFTNIYSFFSTYILYGNMGSNSLRIRIYTESLKEVFSISPLIGMGVKRYLVAGYPLGSHSTYIGLIYKCGILGGILGIIIFGKCAFRLFKAVKQDFVLQNLAFFLFLLLAVFAMEDIDGGNWLIITYFSMMGLIVSEMKERKKIHHV